MLRFRWYMPLLSLALTATAAPAQGIVVYNPYFSNTSVTYTTRVGKHSTLSITTSTPTLHGYGFGFFGPVPRYSYSSSVNIIVYSPQTIVLPRDPLYGADIDIAPDAQHRRQPDRDPDAMADPAMPGRDVGDFRPLEPNNRRRAEQPLPPPEPVPPPVPNVNVPPLPRPPEPEANPVAESTRLIGIGKAAFAEQEYGRAAERFLQASKLAPNEAMPHFLRAQALLAMGKYLEAVDAVNAGLALQPEWPLKRFQPLELYGQHVAAYPEDLRRLEDTLAKHPNDAALMFLYAYQLWFDGRKDEARVLFQRARPGVPDAAMVDRFLMAKPPAPVASGQAPRNWL
jgi:hypothetical protein